jgi:hypothetical protein
MLKNNSNSNKAMNVCCKIPTSAKIIQTQM